MTYFTRKELDEYSPSRRDNIDKDKEKEMKVQVTTFLQDVGKSLQLPQITIATAIVYLHKFFLAHSIVKFDKYMVGTACLFLASKVEENIIKLKEVIWKYINFAGKKKMEEIPQNKEQYFVSQAFKNLKHQILNFESLLLRTLAFDLKISHPYGTLLNHIKTLNLIENKQLAQVSWNFINDSLQRTNLCLQYKPEQIAPAAIFLASNIIQFKIPEKENKPWWEYLNISLELLEEISAQIKELYENGNVRINLDKLEKKTDPKDEKPNNNNNQFFSPTRNDNPTVQPNNESKKDNNNPKPN